MTVADHAEMLEVLLASCATWQTLSRASSVSEAQQTIHQYECDDNATYPRATVMDGPLWAQAVATSQTTGGGTLFLRIDLKPDASLKTRKDRRSWVRGKVMDMKHEMEVLSNSRATPSGYSISHLVLKRVTLDVPPYEQLAKDREIEDDRDIPQDVIWTAQFSVEW